MNRQDFKVCGFCGKIIQENEPTTNDSIVFGHKKCSDDFSVSYDQWLIDTYESEEKARMEADDCINDEALRAGAIYKR